VPLFSRKKPEDEEPVDPEARSPELGVKYKDLMLMGQLIQQGADLHQPRHALYYLYFATKEAATAAGEEGRAAGYACEVRDPLPQYPDQWSVVCERPDALLDPSGVIAADDLFQGIADRHDGEFDGWEAAARP
jgi:Regulator of ribonuclease activity B